MTWVQPPAVIQISSLTRVCEHVRVGGALCSLGPRTVPCNKPQSGYSAVPAPQGPLMLPSSDHALPPQPGIRSPNVLCYFTSVTEWNHAVYILLGLTFFSLSIISLRFIPAGARVDNLFLLIAG